MKKEILFLVLCVIVICVCTFINFNHLSHNEYEVSIRLSNIEAIAEDENPGGNGCYGEGSLLCGTEKYYGKYE